MYGVIYINISACICWIICSYKCGINIVYHYFSYVFIYVIYRSTALAVTLLAARLGAIAGNLVFGSLIDVYCAVPMFMVACLLIGKYMRGSHQSNVWSKMEVPQSFKYVCFYS